VLSQLPGERSRIQIYYQFSTESLRDPLKKVLSHLPGVSAQTTNTTESLRDLLKKRFGHHSGRALRIQTQIVIRYRTTQTSIEEGAWKGHT
jgi:hypothetical protein